MTQNISQTIEEIIKKQATEITKKVQQITASEIIDLLRSQEAYFDDACYDRLIDDIAVNYGLRDPDTGDEKTTAMLLGAEQTVRKVVFAVEVGVLLPKTDKEYESYILFEGKSRYAQMSLYNENYLMFFEEQKAIRYIQQYVTQGVNGTYGYVISLGEQELTQQDIQDIEISACADGVYMEYPKTDKDVLYFIRKEGGEIIIEEDKS